MAADDDPFDAVTALQPDPVVAAGRALRRPRLTWSDAGGQHNFAVDARCVIGAAPQADIVLSDPAVSRLHAELEVRPDGLWVTDLGSSNGTYLETFLVAAARVPSGARLRLGSTVLTVEETDTPAAVDESRQDRFGPLVGRSRVMRALFARLARVAPTDATVLIHGETGTGKELVAWAIHEASPRAAGPFVIVDCGSLPETLLEAELFGHARGAFTGATASRAGAIEAADGGTVFLDEIGEMPLSMQPKLLRAIESRMVRRLGETAYRKVNVRFLSATNRDLRALVNRGAFRDDLYFRLAVLPITLPPLRERIEDIPLLAEALLPAGARGALTPALLQDMAARSWPGNVRELRNFVERVTTLGADEAGDLAGDAWPAAANFPAIPYDQPFKAIRERWVGHLEREYIRELLARLGGNVSAVADRAGLARSYVHRLIRRYGL
jgi:DNA-binding NtrC family response regulator